MGREEGSAWGTHAYLWWIHFGIWKKQYNIVKLKNNIKKNISPDLAKYLLKDRIASV